MKKSDIKNLIEKWTEEKHKIINPSDLNWDDLGFEEKPDDYKYVDDYLEKEDELNEEQFSKVTVINQFLEDLELILNPKNQKNKRVDILLYYPLALRGE